MNFHNSGRLIALRHVGGYPKGFNLEFLAPRILMMVLVRTLTHVSNIEDGSWLVSYKKIKQTGEAHGEISKTFRSSQDGRRCKIKCQHGSS